jgi:hypothetical protein
MPNTDGEEREVNEAEFVRALVPDPADLPDAHLLTGFLAKGGRPERWRLYLTRELDEFIEFEQSGVLHSENVAGMSDDADLTRVWVKASTVLHRSEPTPGSQQAAFLEGDIAAMFAEATARVRRLHAGSALTIGTGGGRGYADPTLFRASTCALSECVSDVAICTNPGQTTCDPAVCFAAPKAYLD